jgi:hypothetical protein
MHTNTALLRPSAGPSSFGRIALPPECAQQTPRGMPNHGHPAAFAVSCHSMAPKGNSQTDGSETTIVLEQFWGRAVRASRDSKEFRRALFLESFDSCLAIGSLSPVEQRSYRASRQRRLGGVLILRFRIRPIFEK